MNLTYELSLAGEHGATVCGAAKIKCYNDAESQLEKQDFINGLSGQSVELGCNCLPACTSITYDAEISQAPFDWNEMLAAHNSPTDGFQGLASSLKIL